LRFHRLSFPDFYFSAIVQKMLPWSFFPDVLPPGFRTVRCPSLEIASSGSFGGRSALLIFVRVALLLPSDDETVPAFAFPDSGKLSTVAEAPAFLSAVRLNLPKNTLRWLALVGFLRFYPPGSGSGPSRRQAFA
jgi:hypothetical protein